jgi:hypothetical protein
LAQPAEQVHEVACCRNACGAFVVQGFEEDGQFVDQQKPAALGVFVHRLDEALEVGFVVNIHQALVPRPALF